MKIYKTYKFRMYPNDTQRIKLNSFLGCKRFIYNYYLTKKLENNNLTVYDLKKDLPNLQIDKPWLEEIDGSILRTTLDDLENAFSRYQKGLSEKPHYKRYNDKQSYRTPCIRGISKDKVYQNIKLDLETRMIKLPKIEPISIKGYRNLTKFNHQIINATVIKEAGKYYVLLLVEEDIIQEIFTPNYLIGLDLGVKDLVISSDGVKYQKLKELEKLETKLKGLNKWLARSQKKSKNREKIILKIRRVNQKIKNKRKFYIHLITNKLIKENDIIIAETLKVKEMIIKGKNKLAKSLTNASLSEIIKNLKYKAIWHNKKFYQIDTYYPSSQICSTCKTKHPKLKDLTIRKWECLNCHSIHDRDINASLNILDEGLKLYMKELQKELKA